MPGSLRLDDDPFASLLSGDPFEAALQSTDKDYHWVLGSPRSRRAEAKYNDDQDDAGAPRFTHVRIAEEKARTRSVGTRAGIASTLFGWLILHRLRLARTLPRKCQKKNLRDWKKNWKSSSRRPLPI